LLGWTAVGGCPHKISDLFGDSEDAGFAGHDQEAVRRIATEPSRPLEAARVDGSIEAVPGHGIGDETG